MRPSHSRPVVVFATAVAGVVAGHVAGYAIAHPTESARAAVLHATGHQYWSAAVAAALAAAAVALALAGVRASRRGDVGVGFGPLAVGQVVLFAAVETVERAATGAPVDALALSPPFMAGVIMQVIVAVAAVTLLRRWGRLVAHLAAPPARRSPGAPGLALALASRTVVTRLVRSAVRTRAPPSLAV